MATIIVKNTTSGNIEIDDLRSFLVVASGTETLSDYFSEAEISSSDDLMSLIASEDLTINNGDSDLSVSNGIKYCLGHYSDVNLLSEVRNADGKLIMQETSRVMGTTTYFTGAGDDPSDVTDVGGGERIILEHTISGSVSESITMDLNIIENDTYIHEGYLTWKNAHHDTVNFEILPRTVDYVVSSNTYYNLYGGYMVVPAAGDGTIQITSDITTHSGGLVQMPLDEEGTRPTAFWNADWNSTTKEFENISAAPYGDGEFNMFTVPVVLSRFANRIPLLGDGFIMLQTADTDKLGHGMRLRLSGQTHIDENCPDHNWSVAGMITFHRAKSC
jgi:hypothetical protein